MAKREAEYACNEEGSCILEAQTPNGWICVDATRHYSAIGRCNIYTLVNLF